MSIDWMPRALEESRARGFLGPGPIGPQIAHAEGFAQCWESLNDTPPADFLDLGSGGGLPGLVLLQRWATSEVFLDSMEKRCEFLREVLARPEAPGKSSVVLARAEEAARWPEMDSQFDLVTSRSFGPPAVTVECAARFLRIGGVLIVSEPPLEKTADRWKPKGLAELGFVTRGQMRFGTGYEVLVKEHPTPNEYPRAIGTPKKKPLF